MALALSTYKKTNKWQHEDRPRAPHQSNRILKVALKSLFSAETKNECDQPQPTESTTA
jgi:hypothetical protein